MLQPASAHDVEFFYRLYMHPQCNPYLLYEPMDRAEFAPIFEELLAAQQLYLWLHQGTPIGMAKLVPQRFRNAHICYLGGVAIDPEHAGKGHGRTMLMAILALLRERGFRRVELSTAVHNHAALKLYQHLGFVIEGTLVGNTQQASLRCDWDEHCLALRL